MCDVNVPAGSIIEVTEVSGETFLAVVGESDFRAMCEQRYPGYGKDGQSVWVLILTGRDAGSPHAVRKDEEDQWQRMHGHIHLDRMQRYALA
jgi:hypothetical protein